MNVFALINKHRSDADNLLIASLVVKKSPEFLLAHPDWQINWRQYLIYKYYLIKRQRGTPFAYLTGHKEFFGLDFFVNKNVLVPRPDTEILISEAINIINNANTPIILIDVGTGSGCIPISIAKSTPTEKIYKIIAIDVSGDALKVAKKNADKHKIAVNFIKSNLFAKYPIFNIQYPLIITANLPYLTNKQFTDEKSIQKEPKLALVADDVNGLSLYKKLLTQIKSLVACHPDANRDLCPITLLLEIDPSQTAEISELVKNTFPKAYLEIKKDLTGLGRTVIIHPSPGI